MTQAKARRLIRLNFSGAFQLEMDRQGRVPLPPALRNYAQVQEEVVIAGTGKYLEIWDRELWDQERVLLDDEAWQIAENMEDRG